jgi:hypothetical protein
MGLMTVNLDCLFGSDAFMDKKFRHFTSLISLQLNYLSLLLIIQDGSVAVEDFFPGFEYSLEVDVFRNTLNNSPALLGISLLIMDVYDHQ